MVSLTLDRPKRMLALVFDDGASARFPFLWLKDNDPAAFHPQTQERIRDLLSFDPEIEPEGAEIEGNTLKVEWPDSAEPGRFPLDWLQAHIPGRTLADPAAIAPSPWQAALGADGIPRTDAQLVLLDDAELARWMRATCAYGVSIVTGLANDPEAGLQIARRAGFLRQTNFGVTFEVKSKPNPNNLAYTADALPLHTDLPNQELPPGFQFLHCLRNDAEGGGSVFADGVALAHALRDADQDAFALLVSTPVPFRFHDEVTDIRSRKPIIVLDERGNVSEICFNAHIAGVLDLPPDLVEPWYRAYRAFMALTRDPAFSLTLKLSAGEMAVFDNRRVLHGRAAFDASTGGRHLRGCYVDRGEWLSRLRVLSRQTESVVQGAA